MILRKATGSACLALLVTSCLLAACSDEVVDESVETTKVVEVETMPVPMNFVLDAGVAVDVSPLDTRAAVGVGDRLFVGEHIGLCILLDTDYDRAREGLPLQSGYRYINVPGRIMPDLSIAVDTTLYYPLYQGSKAAVLAYAPYRADLSAANLYEGLELSLGADQTRAADVLGNDLLVGAPAGGNPYRNTPDAPDTPAIPIVFSHAFSRVFVTLDLPRFGEVFQCDSVFVSLTDIPLRAKSYPCASVIEPEDESRGAIAMLAERYANGVVHGDTVSFESVAIAFPDSFDSQNPPQFAVTLRGRSERPDTTMLRTDTLGTDFVSGRDVRYHIRLGFDATP